MSEITNLTYYQKTRNVILNKAKDYCKNNKERLRDLTRDKIQKLIWKIKKENMGRIGIIICLKKKNRVKKYQKKYREAKKSQKKPWKINNFLFFA